MRGQLVRKQTFVYELQGAVAEKYTEVAHLRSTCGMLLALGGVCWQTALPHEVVKLVFAYARPAWRWVRYPGLTSSLSDPLLPHDPGHMNRDDLHWQFHIPDDQLQQRLWVLDHILQTCEDELGTLHVELDFKIERWRALYDNLIAKTKLADRGPGSWRGC